MAAGSAIAQERCDQGYVWREAFQGDYACVHPDVRAQAQQDNAAAASRWVPSEYGPDACIPGFVWREARLGDLVCVDPTRRELAQYENSVAAERTSAEGNPPWCLPGYVWREAFPGDYVCVQPMSRDYVRDDNARAGQRRGSRVCASGFVWREAGPADWVCVTPQVREQARLDNIEYNTGSRVAGARCNRYGQEAVASYRQAQALGCAVSGPRWSENITGHVNWCNVVASPQLADREGQARRDTLRTCASGQSASNPGGGAQACAVSVEIANSSCINLDGTASSIPQGLIVAHGCGADEATARSTAQAFFKTQSCIGSTAGCCEVVENVIPGCYCR